MAPCITQRKQSGKSSVRKFLCDHSQPNTHAGSQVVIGTYNHSQKSKGDPHMANQESNDDLTMTQTSSHVSSFPSQNLNTITNKIMMNNKEIRRIEKILYKNDNRISKYQKPVNLLS